VRAPSSSALDELAALVRRTPRGLVVAGWGARAEPATVLELGRVTGWPVLADPISNLRVPGVISTYDPLLRVGAFARAHRPDLVLRVGGPLTNKVAMQWLDAQVEQVLVDPDAAWLDPQHAVSARVLADPEPLLVALTASVTGMSADADWCTAWNESERAARVAIDALIDGWREPFEGRVARDVVASLPAGAALALASSMPVRDAESFAAPRHGVRVHANRGVNGIDGFVSTVLGIAAAHDGPTVGLVGDLCFVHDSNGLLGAPGRAIDATFVVVDNDGGGIFSFLPQADLPQHFETVFGTPHGLDLAALAEVHGVPVTEVAEADTVGPAVVDATAAGGVQVVVVRTPDRAANVARHREVWAAVAEAVGDFSAER
jgi:2-succinyl-5-enolpyruvyl-6-hydroxy-3-cyclohexene-1-carboxylate synthase